MGKKPRSAGFLALSAMAVSLLASDEIGGRACAFVRKFDRIAASAQQVSLQERVIYSLIEAKDQGCGCRAPG